MIAPVPQSDNRVNIGLDLLYMGISYNVENNGNILGKILWKSVVINV